MGRLHGLLANWLVGYCSYTHLPSILQESRQPSRGSRQQTEGGLSTNGIMPSNLSASSDSPPSRNGSMKSKRKPGRFEINLIEKASMSSNRYPWYVNESSINPSEVRHIIFIKVRAAAALGQKVHDKISS